MSVHRAALPLTAVVMGLTLWSLSPAYGAGAVEWEIARTVTVAGQPVDVAVSPDGKWTYVLTEASEVLVLDEGGKLEDRIAIAAGADGLEVAPGGDRLLVTNRAKRTLQFISLAFVHRFSLEGVPLKGNADAQVAIVAFNDYQ